MADLDYAKVVGRFALTVGDTPSDVDDDPDTIWCDEGRVIITPLITYAKVAGGVPEPFTVGNAQIEASIDTEGYLSYLGKRAVHVVDLTSPKVNPQIGPGLATHRITFTDVRAQGTVVMFPEVEVRLTAAGDADGENDLTLLMPVPTGEATPITQGPRGTGVQTLAVEAGDLVVTLDDGTEVNAGELPVGPGGSDAGVASYLAADGSATTAATRALVAGDIEAGEGPVASALSASNAAALQDAGTLPGAAVREVIDYRVATLGEFGLQALRPLKTRLSDVEDKRPVAAQIESDSTGNDPNEWPALFADYLADFAPHRTVQTRLWSDAAQRLDAPVTVQLGPEGEQYLHVVPGRSTRRIGHGGVTPITGVMDIRLRFAADDWTPAAGAVFLGRENGAGQRSYWVALNTAGYVQMVVSSDGTNLLTQTSLAHVVSAGFTDGGPGWIRVVFNPNDGAGNRTAAFYTSANGVTWTALGATVTTAGAITLFQPTNSAIDIGGRGGAAGLPGKLYEVEIRDGIDGPNTVPNLPASWAVTPGGTPMDLPGSPILTIVNGSKPGADTAYLSDTARLGKMTPNFGQQVIFISDCHNESSRVDTEFLTLYDGLVTKLQDRFFGIPVVVLTQNPENGGTNQDAHAARRGNLLTYAKAKGLALIDTYRAFNDDPRPLADLMMPGDPIHPNSEGQIVWFNAIRDQWEPLSA